MDSMVMEVDDSKSPSKSEENIDISVDVVDPESGKFPPKNDRHVAADSYLRYLIEKITSADTFDTKAFDEMYEMIKAKSDGGSEKQAEASEVDDEVRPKRSSLRVAESAKNYKVYKTKEKPTAENKSLKIRDVEVFDKSLLNKQNSQKHGGNYRAAPAYYDDDDYDE